MVTNRVSNTTGPSPGGLKAGIIYAFMCLWLAAVSLPGHAAALPTLSIQATTPQLQENIKNAGAFTVTRTGSTDAPLTVLPQHHGRRPDPEHRPDIQCQRAILFRPPVPVEHDHPRRHRHRLYRSVIDRRASDRQDRLRDPGRPRQCTLGGHRDDQDALQGHHYRMEEESRRKHRLAKHRRPPHRHRRHRYLRARLVDPGFRAPGRRGHILQRPAHHRHQRDTVPGPFDGRNGRGRVGHRKAHGELEMPPRAAQCAALR